MRFFFYGTLIDASDTPMARWLRPRLRASVRASIAGRLIAIPTPHGWYPALLPAPWLRVRGVCCELDLRPADLARLDRYEGREYRRGAVSVRAGARKVSAQVYHWRGAIPPGSVNLTEGDFLRWLQSRRLRAYSLPLSGQWSDLGERPESALRVRSFIVS